MCHHNTFLIYSSIEDANQKKWELVTHASILTSLIVACLFGIAGYTTFKAFSQGARNVQKKINRWQNCLFSRRFAGKLLLGRRFNELQPFIIQRTNSSNLSD